MKRSRDDVCATSQFKRPFASSGGESFGKSQLPAAAGVGSNGGGGVSGGAGGDAGAEEGGGGEAPIAVVGGGGGGTSQKLTTSDALSYLKEVKEMFQDQKEKYETFLEVMKDFKAQRADTVGVIERVKELFKGHNNLIYGFNTFLPKGYEITLDEDEAPPKKTVEFKEAISFVNKIKKRFQNDEHIYKSFLDILNLHRKEHKDIQEVCSEVASLFAGHPDLLEEFTRFLPESSANPSTNQVPLGKNTFQRHNVRSSASPTMRQIHTDKQRCKEKIVGSHIDRGLSVDHLEIDGDKAVVKMQKDQKKRIEENRDHKVHDKYDRETEHDDNRDYNMFHPDKRRAPRKIEGLEVNYLENRDNFKSMYNEGFIFCEKVKERLSSSDDYQAFLKCLNIYSNGIIKRNDLQNLVTDLLGKYPDLMAEFNHFVERCENIDGFLAGVISKKSITEGHTSRSKMEERDSDKKREAKGIQELDLSNRRRCTPSYRLLPDDYQIPTASQRSELGAQVLNDHWVSVTSGSEDYSFKHMRRNQYEESLFRCEDDRFELDMLLESVSSTAKRVEELLKSINDSKVHLDSLRRVEAHLSDLNLRCIERIYGDHGLDVMDILRKNPALALSVILTRLKQKQDEWTRCRADFNKVWAEIYSKNHYKSLDHRSFYFKQQDSKNLSAKSLVAEIKELKEKNQKEDNLLLVVAAGHRQPLAPHLEYEYSDVGLHDDLYKLIQYSCEEMCSTKEQLNKVSRLWTTFMESMLGVQLQSHCVKGTENAGKAKNPAINSNISSLDEYNETGIPATQNTAVNSRPHKIVNVCDENCPPEPSNSCRNIFANGGTMSKEHLGRASWDGLKVEKEGKNVDVADKWPGLSLHSSNEEVVNSIASLADAFEDSHGRNNIEVEIGCDASTSRFTDAVCADRQTEVKLHRATRSEVADAAKPVYSANSELATYGAKISRSIEESVRSSKIEKEEGELSPNCDFEEDNFIGYREADVELTPKRKHGIESMQYQSAKGEEIHCEDRGGENDVNTNADDEDSENVSEGGDDASASESAGDECSREEHEQEEDVEHDEIDGKAESEGEADGVANAHFVGDTVPSDHFVLSVRPLTKQVTAAVRNRGRHDAQTFYGNDDFYVLFRLHQILYERLLSAKTNCTGTEMQMNAFKDISSSDHFGRFVSALYNLLDGSIDNSKFEDECRAIIGNQSYILFTLDKLIYKLVKQLQTVAMDEMDNTLVQLYKYEKSRKRGWTIDSVYYENACVPLHEENIYRIESSSCPTRLSIQLMDHVIEKPEAFAFPMDPNFSDYLHNDFLSVFPSKKEAQGIALRRNKRKYVGLDEYAANCIAMEGVELINGLECKIGCNSCKISYVLDTEDFFFRRRKKSECRSPSNSQGRRERFHHGFLSASR